MGIAVFAGMIGVTLFGLFLTPVFFVTIETLFGRRRAVLRRPTVKRRRPSRSRRRRVRAKRARVPWCVGYCSGFALAIVPARVKLNRTSISRAAFPYLLVRTSTSLRPRG